MISPERGFPPPGVLEFTVVPVKECSMVSGMLALNGAASSNTVP
jgi:hypothetical protein